mgnify:CR=1 FL=1
MKAYVKGLLGLVAVAAIGLGSYWGYHKWQASKVPVSYETVAKTAQTPEEKADALLKDMSDADKVGQLVMFGVHGKDVTEDSRYMINAFKPAGIILFDRNMESKDQVKTLISHLNQVAKDNGNVPMFMAIDQEGGAVTRMSDQLIQAPPAEVLGTESVATAVDWAHKSGQELKDLGFNLNFAPDADLGLSYGRSFSKNPDKVIDYAYNVGQAYHDQGLWFSYKHFPGIGKTGTDLHADSSTVTATKDQLMAEDTKVFASLMKKTPANEYMLMVSHAIYPDLDATNPSSLSKAIITDLLRNELGYQGVVVIDDMEMGAVSNHYSFADMAIKSINAGADLLLVCHDYGHMQEVYNGLLKAVKNGDISQDRLNEAVKRVLVMKFAQDK